MEVASLVLEAYGPLLRLSCPEDILGIGVESPIPRFDISTLKCLCGEARNAIMRGGIVVHTDLPTVVVGDLHGNLHDLIRIWNMVDDPFSKRFVFLGDYVDRGNYSIELITLLFALRTQYPDNIYIIRGNHEFASVNKIYGFYEEVMETYQDETLYDAFNEVFSYLPLAAILDNRVFCIHGGLSPHLATENDILKLPYPFLPSDSCDLVTDLVWSDPTHSTMDYITSTRGLGVNFGTYAVHQFLMRNQFKLILRAHESVTSGIKSFADGKLITVFSSSGYTSGRSLGGYANIDTDAKAHVQTFQPITFPKRAKAEFVVIHNCKKRDVKESLSCMINLNHTFSSFILKRPTLPIKPGISSFSHSGLKNNDKDKQKLSQILLKPHFQTGSAVVRRKSSTPSSYLPPTFVNE